MTDMIRWVLVLMLSCATLNIANAQDDSSIEGTHSVEYQPVQISGELQGCTLVYRAVKFDQTYLDGSPVVIVGNIGLRQVEANIILTLKVGIKNLIGNGKIERPNFAYLQTNSFSTAKVKQQAMDGEEGFKLYAYSLYDSGVIGLYGEMLDTGKVVLAFNRHKGGMDVLVPIDLNVSDAQYPDGDKVVRTRSKVAMNNFAECSTTLATQAQESNKKIEATKK